MTRTSKALLASVAATLVFLALAILGYGSITAFFAQPVLCVLAVATIVMAIVGAFSQGSLSTGEQEDRSNRWVLIPFTLIGFASGFVPAYTERLGLWMLDGDVVRWLGVGLYIAGGALRLAPVFVLGRRFSGLVAIQSGHTLVTTGLYRTVRNPSYLGLLVNAIGWALAFRSLIGLLLAMLYVPPLIARMHSEERLLQAHFGAEYAAYRARTWRLIPGIY